MGCLFAVVRRSRLKAVQAVLALSHAGTVLAILDAAGGMTKCGAIDQIGTHLFVFFDLERERERENERETHSRNRALKRSIFFGAFSPWKMPLHCVYSVVYSNVVCGGALGHHPN